MLGNSLSVLRVHLVLYQLFKQALCVSYVAEMILGSFGNVTVNEIMHYVLCILLALFRDNFITNQ